MKQPLFSVSLTMMKCYRQDLNHVFNNIGIADGFAIGAKVRDSTTATRVML